MTFEQFKHVLEITKTGSINQAASNLFSSQAALSLSIKNLEQELGQTIFLRNNRGIQLTSFGKEFISYIRPICSQMIQLEQMCRRQASDNHMTFSVSSNGYRFVAPVCAKLYRRYRPLGIHIYHLDGIGDETIDYVENHQAELGIVRIWDCYKSLYNRQFTTKKLQFFPLARIPLCIMVGRGSPLFHLEIESIPVDMLSDYPMVVHSYLHTGPYSDIFNRLHIPYNRNRIITGSRAVIYDTLEHTDAYYISSDSKIGYRNLETPMNIRSFSIENCEIQSEIGWIKHEDASLSPIAKEFIKEITLMFQEE